jgi:hypothetical protein
MIGTRKRGNCVFKAKKRRSDEQRRRKGERKERREKKSSITLGRFSTNVLTNPTHFYPPPPHRRLYSVLGGSPTLLSRIHQRSVVRIDLFITAGVVGVVAYSVWIPPRCKREIKGGNKRGKINEKKWRRNSCNRRKNQKA